MNAATPAPTPPRARQTHAVAFAEYAAAREAAITQFSHGSRIQSLWRGLSSATDRLLSHIAGDTGLTLIAVGGYGRGEMFPFSDVDLLVLVDDTTRAQSDQATTHIVQHLWDQQIPVSHATRTLDETIAAAQADSTITAALMDARFICGNRGAYRALKKRVSRDIIGVAPRAFVAAKLAERDRRHSKWGDSRLMLEPNIKEGKGGLRDLQTLTWLARYCYPIAKASELVREDLLSAREWQHFREAYVFFSTVRAHMHLARGRADERLTFDLQTHCARAMQFRGTTAQEKAQGLMLRYFQLAREVGALTRIFCAILEEENLRTPVLPLALQAKAVEHEGNWVVDANRIAFMPDTDLSAAPMMAVALFHHAQQHGLDIHPRAQLAINRALPSLQQQLPFEGQAHQLFLSILLSPKAPETTLRRMSEMGVLGALIPEFSRITGMMQYDGYHTYTVDEHTLVAIGNLAMIETGAWEKDMPLATAVAKEISDRATLYLAMLGHDLAKGTGGMHAQKGEAIVAHIATRLGLSAAQGDMAGWLVKHHLLLSETAFKRDLDDSKTIEDFVAIVQSPERLRLLLLLTVADVKAVGPAIWNRWKGALMRELYRRAMLWMGVGLAQEVAATSARREHLLAEVPSAQHATAERLLDEALPASWWQRPLAEQLASIEAFDAWQRAPDTPAIVIRHDHFRAVSEMVCCMAYTPRLFRDLAGVIAWVGVSIVSARGVVLPRGVMLATFGMQDVEGNSLAQDEKRLAPLRDLIAKAQAGTLDFARELPRRRHVSPGREVAVEPLVFIDNQVSATASVIEVNARDRIGLLYDILGALNACQLQVVTAHIATYGKKAVDVFYVKDAYGIKIIHPTKLAMVQEALRAVCHDAGHA